MRSCEVVPPFDAATQTIPAIESAATRYSVPTQPIRTKTRQVRSSVATVIPEIGFDDEPISPVSRDETVTNRNPKSGDHQGADDPPGHVDLGGKKPARRDHGDQGGRADADDPERQVAVGPARSTAPVAPDRARSPRPDLIEPRINGIACKRLITPPAATAPAPI